MVTADGHPFSETIALGLLQLLTLGFYAFRETWKSKKHQGTQGLLEDVQNEILNRMKDFEKIGEMALDMRRVANAAEDVKNIINEYLRRH